jgi:hypothetical protein
LLTMLAFALPACRVRKDTDPVKEIQITVQYHGRYRYPTPPLSHVFFDVEARNPTQGFAWIMLPSHLYQTEFSPVEVAAVEYLRAEDANGEVELYQLSGGVQAMQAIPLPAGSRIVLKDFEIGGYDWPLKADTLLLTYFTAEDFVLQNPDLQEVVSKVNKDAPMNYDGEFSGLKPVKTQLAQGLKPSPIQFRGLARHEAVIPLRAK